MINHKIFVKGLKSNLGVRSPTVSLAACFIALGALLKDAGFNLQQSAASSFFTYALPGQLVMAESLLIGTSLINIFIAVWLVNFRLYPMTVSLFPLLKHKSQPKWKYYLSSHFLAVSSWLVAKDGYRKIQNRFLDRNRSWNLVHCSFNDYLRISFSWLPEQRYDDWSCNCKSSLFFLYDDWRNEKHKCFYCSNRRNSTWSDRLYIFNRVGNIICRVDCWNRCFFIWRK